MLTCVLTLLLITAAQADSKTAALPDTPQGRRVQAFIAAFNTGDEKQYLAMQNEQFEPAVLKRRSVEERQALFQRIRGDFGSLKIARIVKASAEQIQVVIPTNDGAEGTFTFNFEATKPFRISGMGIELNGGFD